MKILVINGPNLNMLGIREPEVYGSNSYDDLIGQIKDFSDKTDGLEVETYQSNHEGDIVDRIQKAYFEKYDGIVINPAAYTHTSIAIADALKAVSIPCVEVHLSNVLQREDYRRISYVEDVVDETIMGKGFEGYIMGIKYLVNKNK